MAGKHCFDSKCLELAEYFYPHATREWLANLAQQFQDAAESAEDVDDKTLAIPDFLRNQDNLRAERASQETRSAPACGYCEDEPGYCKVCGGITCPIVGCKIKGKHEHTIIGPGMDQQRGVTWE